MILAIEWQFGSWKTSFAVKLAMSLQWSRTLVLSNIKMGWIQNYIYFKDSIDLLNVFRFANILNDFERKKYILWEKNWLPQYDRSKFTKILIFLDEAGALFEGRQAKKFDAEYTQYLNQVRKNNIDLYLITPDGTQVEKNLRRHVDWYYYSKPLLNIPVFKDFKVVRRAKKDLDWKILMEQYLWRDEAWDYIVKQKPLDFFETIYWQVPVRNFYDDWHKNIIDEQKDWAKKFIDSYKALQLAHKEVAEQATKQLTPNPIKKWE